MEMSVGYIALGSKATGVRGRWAGDVQGHLIAAGAYKSALRALDNLSGIVYKSECPKRKLEVMNYDIVR
jgi:hypothetical protein